MNYVTILAVAMIGITATVYLVKSPLNKHDPQPILDEYAEKLSVERQKALNLVSARENCNRNGGVLIVDPDGKYACAIRKNIWPWQ
jgi:hypothetical protein